MDSVSRFRGLVLAWLAGYVLLAGAAFAADSIAGQVLGGGAPIAQSTVTLWAASAGSTENNSHKPRQTPTENFSVHGTAAQDASLYLVATGGIPAANKASGNNSGIALLAVVGSKPRSRVVINEFTTIASVVTHAQLIDNTTIKGSPLQLRIAANNVPNFVELETGSWGTVILDGLNSAQTPTMANFGTLANILAGCVTQVRSDACSSLFYVATSPTGVYPKDTLAAVEAIVRYPSYQADKILGSRTSPCCTPLTPASAFAIAGQIATLIGEAHEAGADLALIGQLDGSRASGSEQLSLQLLRKVLRGWEAHKAKAGSTARSGATASWLSRPDLCGTAKRRSSSRARPAASPQPLASWKPRLAVRSPLSCYMGSTMPRQKQNCIQSIRSMD